MAKTPNDDRADQILEMLVAGLTRREILRWVATRTQWGIGERQADRLISRARSRLEGEAEPKRAVEFGKATHRLEMLFARCLQNEDFHGALAVEKERIDLLNLRDGEVLERLARLEAAIPGRHGK